MRRKIELNCPADNIPKEIVIDLSGTDIGTSIKISAVKLPENVIPTIKDQDFVVATVAAPTVIKSQKNLLKPRQKELTEKRLLRTEGSGVKAAEQGKDGDAAKKDKQKDAGGDKKPQAEKKPAEKK